MAGNTFLEITGPDIKGETTDSAHKDQIEVLSWSHSFSQPTSATRSSAGGGTVEMASHSDLNFQKYLDSASDDIIKACWSGKHQKKATLHCYRADGDNKPVKYLEIVMEDVVVSNYSVGGGSGDIPVESASLNYGVVTYKYTPADQLGVAKGVQPVKHDLVKREVS
jgi:type VI secretion system secreted protein Hcp